MGNTASAAARDSANDQSTGQDHNSDHDRTISNDFHAPPWDFQDLAQRTAHQRRERGSLARSGDSGNDTNALPVIIHDSNILLSRSRREPTVLPLPSQGTFYMTRVAPVLDQIPSLPTDATCSVCWQPLTGDVVEMEACNHHYNTACILKWFETDAPRDGDKRGTCPNCRREFYSPDMSAADEFETLSGRGEVAEDASEDDGISAPRSLLESIRRSFEAREWGGEGSAQTGGESERPPPRFRTTQSRDNMLGSNEARAMYEDDAREFAMMERE